MTPLRILVVDDNDVIRGMLRFMLEKLGHAVVAEASTGAAALTAYAAHRPGLVTLDISLGDMNGLEVLKRLRADDPAARVVVVTGNNSAVLARDVMAAGAHALMLKPFNFTRLQELLAGLGEAP